MTGIVDAASYLFTSESVTEGHPDKMCDQISDAILDAILRNDPAARVACETATTTGTVVVLGEITTTTYVEFQSIVRETIRDIGYTDARYGFDYRTCGTLVSVHEQSPDIRRGVDDALEIARPRRRARPGRRRPGHDVRLRLPRDPELMPLPIALAHRLAAAPGRGPQGRLAALPAAGRQDAGHGRVRARRAQGRPDHRRGRPARRGGRHRAPPRRHHRAGHQPGRAAQPAARRPDDPRQPDRPLRHRRPDGRRRPDRPQDHRRHVRRHGPPRRRRVQRQGSVQGRPLGGLCGALGGQEHRRRRPRRPLRGRGRYAIGVARPLSISIETFGTGRIPDDAHPGPHRPPLRPAAAGDHRRSSTCAGPSTARPPPTATSAGPTWTCRGSAPTWRPPWPTTPASRSRSRRPSPDAWRTPGSARGGPEALCRPGVTHPIDHPSTPDR